MRSCRSLWSKIGLIGHIGPIFFQNISTNIPTRKQRSQNFLKTSLQTLLIFFLALSVQAAEILVEAESFPELGGWKLDTQFITEMGSPYLLAHGLGSPVKDATTTLQVKEAGTYRLFVRTKDWVARWKAPGQPGRFQVLINGKAAPNTFGTEGANWHWQDGGKVTLPADEVTLALHDLTGFNGRCDALYFTTGEEPPTNDSAILPTVRVGENWTGCRSHLK